MGRPPAAPEARALLAPADLREGPADVPSFLRGLHHLGDEALRPLAATIAVTDPARAYMEAVIPRAHGRMLGTESSVWLLEC